MKMPLLLLTLLLLLPISSRAENLKVFIFAGQGNMIGAGKADDLPDQPVNLRAPQKDVLYAARDTKPHGELVTTGSAANPWTLLQPVKGTFGPEIAFGSTVSQGMPPESVAIVKIAAAEQNLADRWNPENKTGLYPEMLDFVRSAMERREKAGDKVELAGFVWYQGEADAHNEKNAAAYKENLTNFISRIRADFNAPELPFVAVKIGIRTKDPGKYESTVRSGIEEVCSTVPHAAWVSVDGLPMLDGRALDSNAQLELGKRLAYSWQKLADKP